MGTVDVSDVSPADELLRFARSLSDSGSLPEHTLRWIENEIESDAPDFASMKTILMKASAHEDGPPASRVVNDLRTQFMFWWATLDEAERASLNVSSLSSHWGVTRQTIYNWLERCSGQTRRRFKSCSRREVLERTVDELVAAGNEVSFPVMRAWFWPDGLRPSNALIRTVLAERGIEAPLLYSERPDLVPRIIKMVSDGASYTSVAETVLGDASQSGKVGDVAKYHAATVVAHVSQ